MNSSSPQPILLVGAGLMAVEYSKVLTALDRSYIVMGRGDASATTFRDATGIQPTTGPLLAQLAALDTVPSTAIVTVNAMFLADVASELGRAGVTRLLLEKPGALDTRELQSLVALVAETGVEVRIGYNRRFMSSVLAAREMVAADGGVLSVKFDFSEPSRRIAALQKPQRELDTWFYGNSSHVVDLGLSFAGDGEAAHGNTAGSVSWHPDAGVFTGTACMRGGVLVSWHANWIGPGRWGLEVTTRERRLILQPLERLRVQDHSSFDEQPFELDLELDTRFKPGLMRQLLAFLDGDGDEHLPDLVEHVRRWPLLETIRTGAAFAPEQPS